MENRFGAPASGTPERSARREFELLLLLGGSRKGAVQLWKWERRQRIHANTHQAAGRLAIETKSSRGHLLARCVRSLRDPRAQPLASKELEASGGGYDLKLKDAYLEAPPGVAVHTDTPYPLKGLPDPHRFSL